MTQEGMRWIHAVQGAAVIAFTAGCAVEPDGAGEYVPPPPPALLLFSVNDAYLPDGRAMNGRAVGVARGDTSVAPPRSVYRLALVRQDAVELDGRFSLTMDDYRSISADGWMFFIGGPPTNGPDDFQISVLAAGEGGAAQSYVSMADALTLEFTPCGLYCTPTLTRLTQDYFVFGWSEYPPPTSGAPLSYSGIWRGSFARTVYGEAMPGHIKVSGEAHLSVRPDSGTMTGRLVPVRVVNGNGGGTLDLDMSDVVLSGTSTGSAFEGTAEASLNYVSPDDRLVGTFQAALYGPNHEEIGGVMTLDEDYSHIGGADPNTALDVTLIGAFVGRK